MNEVEAHDDAHFAIAARSGDRRAFEALVALHKASLYRIARRYVGQSDDAYDLVQETFVAAWLSLSRFDGRQSFGPWVRTILLNKCRDLSRRHAVRRRFMQWFGLEESDSPVDDFSTADSATADTSDARLVALDRAVAMLPARLKEPLVLTALQGLSHREAAAQLGLTPKAVELRVHRARRKLQELLQQTDE